MGKKVLSLIAVFLLLVASSASAYVDIPVTAAGDGYWHNEVGSSYDYWDGSGNGVSAYYTYWGTSDTMQFNTGYAQFGLGAAPEVADISSVTLNLYLNGFSMSAESPSSGKINHRSNSTGATGNASQQYGGDQWVATLMPSLGTGWNSFDVTDFVKNDLTAGYNWAAFSFDPDTAGYFRDSGFNFASAESGNAAYLRIVTADATNGGGAAAPNAVPEPMTMSLFGLGGAALAFARRRVL